MDQESIPSLIAPIPVHWKVMNKSSNIVEQLREELSIEKARSDHLLSELVQEQKRIQHLECYITALQMQSKKGIPQVGSHSSLASMQTCADEEPDDFPLVGKYPPFIRAEKIRRYKEKRRRYHAKVKVSRNYNGRSEVARSKPRIKGRFVSFNA